MKKTMKPIDFRFSPLHQLRINLKPRITCKDPSWPTGFLPIGSLLMRKFGWPMPMPWNTQMRAFGRTVDEGGLLPGVLP